MPIKHITICDISISCVRCGALKAALAGAEQKAVELQQQIGAYRELSTSLAYEDA